MGNLETEMKKIIFFIIFCIILNSIWCEDAHLEKIMSINNGINDNELVVRNHLDEDDDITGNVMKISPKGEIFIHCRDKHEIYNTDVVNKKLIPVFNSKFLPQETYAIFFESLENSFLFLGYSGRLYLIDKNYNLKFKTEILHYMDIRIIAAYYDEDSDIVFFRDPNDNLYSIIHPDLIEENNKSNFRNSSETQNLILSGEYGEKFSLADNEYKLVINGELYRWGDAILLKKNITVINKDLSYINLFDGKKRQRFFYNFSENEVLESYDFHPCGDAYFLTINWNTNTHTIWYIKNTWEPEFREQWYQNHPEALKP